MAFFIDDTDHHDWNGNCCNDKTKQGIKEEGKAITDDDQTCVMRMTDLRKDSRGDQLTMVGSTPEVFPPEIEDCAKKEEDHPCDNGWYQRGWKKKSLKEDALRSDEDDEK
jgi:hypothetical protein